MLRRFCIGLVVILCLSASLAPSGRSFAKDDDFTPEKLVAEHIKSVGNPQLVRAVKSRTFVGTSTVQFIQGLNGTLSGHSMFISEGVKLGIVMRFGDKDYPGEYFAYDGNDVTVANMTPGQRSPLADFIYRYNGLIKEGLVGGVMSGSWPLLSLEEKGAVLKYHESTIGDRKLHMLEYRPKKGLGDVKIKLYFDWESFRHVRTEYNVRHREDASGQSQETYAKTMSVRRDAASAPEQISGRFILDGNTPESIYQLVEKYDDFKKTGALTLPQSYQIEYSVEGQGPTFIAKWDMKASKWGFNSTFDEKIFKAQK